MNPYVEQRLLGLEHRMYYSEQALMEINTLRHHVAALVNSSRAHEERIRHLENVLHEMGGAVVEAPPEEDQHRRS